MSTLTTYNFDVDAQGWTSIGAGLATVVRSTTTPDTGAGCLLVTATAAGNNAARSVVIPIVRAQTPITVTARIRQEGAVRPFQGYIEWTLANGGDAGGNAGGANLYDTAMVLNTYETETWTVTPPAGATGLRVVLNQIGAAIGNAFRADNIVVADAYVDAGNTGSGPTDMFRIGATWQRRKDLTRNPDGSGWLWEVPAGTVIVGNFQSHTVQPYSAHTSMWGVNIPQNDQLVATSSMRVFSQFPAKTELSWAITQTDPDWNNVNGYLHVDYGNYDWSPGQIVPRQVKDITALDLDVTWTLTGAAAGLLSELWLSSVSMASGDFNASKTHEVAFFPHLSAEVVTYVQSLSAVGSGSFTANGTTWNVVEGDALTGQPYLIAYRPGFVDFEGALPYKAFFTFLQGAGKITGNEWVNGVAFGVEPRSGVGKLTVDTFVPTYTYGPITPDLVVPTNLITNGTFTTDETGWSGFWFSGKSVAGGKAVFAAAPAFDGIAQPISLTAGKYYDVAFTVSGYSAGAIRAKFSGGTARDGALRSANGTFTERLLANTGNTTFDLLPGSDGFSGSLDEVSVVGPYDTA